MTNQILILAGESGSDRNSRKVKGLDGKRKLADKPPRPVNWGRLMSVVLYVLGGLAVMLGATLVGFGIPIKEFGIGNTLIMSGSVVFTGGLLLFGLAAAVSHLVRLTDLMAARGPARDARSPEPFERVASAAPAGGEGRIPFPTRPKANVPPVAEVRPPLATPAMPAIPADGPAGPSPSPSLAPSLRNPDLAFDDRDEPPKSAVKPPVKPASERAAPAPDMNLPPPPPLPSTFAKPAAPPMPPPPPRPAPTMRPPQPNYFDTVWSGDGKPAPLPEAKDEEGAEFRPVPRFDAPEDVPPPFAPPKAAPPLRPEPPKAETTAETKAAPEPDKPAGEEMHAAAVLKSGVVDGMAYTLYVDGSIEAELPDGTLRFASINALREHLEKGGG